ncbi:MAG: hypothetical protein H0U32_06545 [Thermoleophilaceae bacterium]|nr:hypothetical protein [Thermoleophilaceae bacterium]
MAENFEHLAARVADEEAANAHGTTRVTDTPGTMTAQLYVVPRNLSLKAW